MENKKIYLSSPTMHGEEQKFIQEAFDTNWVAPLGPNVNAFEKEMEAYTGAAHASALSAGTAGIHLALRILGIGEGDLVFAPTLTFSATCNPIVYEKAAPVFIDSEEDTWNMSPAALEKAFKTYGKPKAVIVVHLYGTPAKLSEIMEICNRYQVPLVEDAAESLSSTYEGKQTGTFGKIGIYSFNGNKIITTSGGGMLVSDEEAITKKATFLATQARDPARYYQHSQIGYNYRMSNITAGIGRGQLLHLEEHKALKKKIMDALAAENIESRPIWKPMHLQPVFAEYDYVTEKDGCSVAADIFDRGFCLPSDIKNTDEDMDRIIRIVRGCFGK